MVKNIKKSRWMGRGKIEKLHFYSWKAIGTCYVFQIPANGMSKGKWKKEREKRASTFHPICIYWDVRGLHARIEVESFTLIERSCAFMTPPRKISISRAFLPGKDSIYIYIYMYYRVGSRKESGLYRRVSAVRTADVAVNTYTWPVNTRNRG